MRDVLPAKLEEAIQIANMMEHNERQMKMDLEEEEEQKRALHPPGL